MNTINLLKRQKEMLKNWGFRRIPPFGAVPPDNLDFLMEIFTDREDELARAILSLYEGENVVLRGMWGIGKTAFILVALQLLQREAATVKSKMLTCYVGNLMGGDADIFYRAILYSLAKVLAGEDDEAAQLFNALVGKKVAVTETKKAIGKVGVSILSAIELGTGLERGRERVEILEIKQPLHYIDRLLDIATERKYRRVVVAVDDLDKIPNLQTVRAMLDDALPLLRDKRCAFVLTGTALSITQDIYASMLGVIHEQIYLHPLSSQELRQIVINYLNASRQPAMRDNNPYPFTEETISEMTARAFGLPRQLNVIAGGVLEFAIREGVQEITPDVFEKYLTETQHRLISAVTPEVRQVLQIARRQGGFAEDMPLEVLDELGFSTFAEVLPLIDYLMRNDLLVRREDGDVARFIPSALAQ